ncbi:septum formation protein Maf [Candidatus Marinamargulisbacteria bacterium SCGC AG-343-K17]|nr:septum formation protein Maf [Candidatus Marinamargulisbacteria bacterium SCGC AG-343-K17]
MAHIPLILASKSAIRQQILKDRGLTFETIPANIDERSFKALDAIGIAKEKALKISKSYPKHWVIGADQVCHLNGHVFHKPNTIKNAIKTLQQLEGKTHTLLTAACIAHNNVIIWEGIDKIELTMKPLSTKEIETYVNNDQPLQSCGAYCYEGLGKNLFSFVSHPAESIQGLPLNQLLKELLKLDK